MRHQPVSKRRSRMSPLVIAGGLLVLPACASDQDPTPPFVLQPGAVSFLEEDSGAIEVGEETLSFPLALAQQRGVEPGAVVFGGRPTAAFLRTVTSIQVEGDRLIAATEPASLTDAFRELEVDISTAAGPNPSGIVRQGLSAAGEFGWTETSTVALADDVSLVVATTFSAGLDGTIAIKKGQLQKFRFVLKGGFHTSVEADYSPTSQAKFSVLTATPVPRTRVAGPYLILVGACPMCVPVVVSGQFELKSGITVDSLAQMVLRFGGVIDGTMEAGVAFEDGHWAPVKDSGLTAQMIGPELEGRLSARLEAYLQSRFYLILYEIAGPFIELEPHTGVALESAIPQAPYVEWSVDAGLRGAVGGEIAVLGFERSLEFPLFDLGYDLGSGRFNCLPHTCTTIAKECGTWDDNCAGTVTCGPCPGGSLCNLAAGTCEVACAPATCSQLGRQCGTWPNGCGGSVVCGPCTAGSCNSATGQCEAMCMPQTCTQMQRACGTWDNGCGTSVTCGPCAGNESCNWTSGSCEAICNPQTCTGLGRQCGTWNTGCGWSITCGPCQGGKSCNTATGQCETTCIPKSCSQIGKQCGTWGDGCGGTVTCGPCGGGLFCNTATGQCESNCTPTTCSQLGKQCGTWDSGCGDSILCGGCATGGVCNPLTGQCETTCPPLACADLGHQCGTWDDGCGHSVTCGPCAEGSTCQTTTGQCVAVCNPDCTGRECGDDGCDWICGVCEPDESCVGGVCSACVSHAGYVCIGNSVYYQNSCGELGTLVHVCQGGSSCFQGTCRDFMMITVWDSGGDADDSFELFVFGRSFGVTPVGGSRTWVPEMETWPAGTHDVSLAGVSTPDDVGTFSIQFESNAVVLSGPPLTGSGLNAGVVYTWTIRVAE